MPDTSGFFVSASGIDVDTLGVQFVRVWRMGDPKIASWRDDVFMSGSESNPSTLQFHKNSMKLSDLVPLTRVPFYGRHVPAPVSQIWYKQRYQMEDIVGVAEPPRSVLDAGAIARHSPPREPALPHEIVFGRTCSEAAKRKSLAASLEENHDSFAYALKFSLGGEVNFDSLLDSKGLAQVK